MNPRSLTQSRIRLVANRKVRQHMSDESEPSMVRQDSVQTAPANIRSVPEQISDARNNNPRSIALSYGAQQLTYEEFDHRADQFAAYLIDLGTTHGDAVAICMERSFDWIIAALGIMRAGAAYVPLDPTWPDSRLRFAVEDSGAAFVVARAPLLNRLQSKARGIDPECEAATIADCKEFKRRNASPESLAYVIYTSGSTGVPKGVEITHANLSHVITWHRDTFTVTRQDRASHLLGLGFDATVLEIWAHLCAGATLSFIDDRMRASPELIQEWMVGDRVTIGLVPAVLGKRLIAMEWPATTALRLLIVGGEALQHGPAANLPFEVVNNYGPTECTIVSTWATLKPGADGMPPIGRPIAGATVYLLDEQEQPVADGEVGEIYVGGSIVGRGYRNQPDLTKRHFLPDPFAAAPNARMYRTGDRAVRRPDGQLEFRGRLDRQTKIQGQRVELDEISNVLNQHPSLRFATVISSISHAGENELVAYVLPEKNVTIPTVEELQDYLLRSVPYYMVPNMFVQLPTFPLSANGKVDPMMLAKPNVTNLLKRMPEKSVPTPTQRKLLIVVQEVLENTTVRAEDNFFLIGGNSLLGMRLITRVREALGIDLTLQHLFEAPTVARLAVLVESAFEDTRLAAIWADLLGRVDVGLDDNFFELGGNSASLTSLQGRIAAEFDRVIPFDDLLQSVTVRQQMTLIKSEPERQSKLPPGVLALGAHQNRRGIFWVHYLNADLAKTLGDHQPYFWVNLTTEDVASLGEAPTLQEIAQSLLGKIAQIQSIGPYAIGGLCLGAILAYEIARQLRAAGHEVSLLALVDPPSPSYLKLPRPLAARLIHPRYILKRASRLGLRATLLRVRKRLFGRFSRANKTETRRIQQFIETAVSGYRPGTYEGKVLLILATDHPPHVDFLPGWQSVIPRDLSVEYINGHHSEIMDSQNARSVAEAIISHQVVTN
jgi:amino acid adenylation domain-containing protein